MMAAAEIEGGARLFYRNADANTWGVLNVREAFAQQNPELVPRVLKVYEQARQWSVANPKELKAMLVAAIKLPEPVIARQLERTDLTQRPIGQPQAETILAAGLALQQAGVIELRACDVTATVGRP